MFSFIKRFIKPSKNQRNIVEGYITEFDNRFEEEKDNKLLRDIRDILFLSYRMLGSYINRKEFEQMYIELITKISRYYANRMNKG